MRIDENRSGEYRGGRRYPPLHQIKAIEHINLHQRVKEGARAWLNLLKCGGGLKEAIRYTSEVQLISAAGASDLCNFHLSLPYFVVTDVHDHSEYPPSFGTTVHKRVALAFSNSRCVNFEVYADTLRHRLCRTGGAVLADSESSPESQISGSH